MRMSVLVGAVQSQHSDSLPVVHPFQARLAGVQSNSEPVYRSRVKLVRF